MTVEGMRSFADRLDPALVVPAVAYLAHEDSPDSGEMYTVVAGHLARFFIARTNGYFNPALSMEDVRDHFAEIREETGYAVPRDPGEAGGCRGALGRLPRGRDHLLRPVRAGHSTHRLRRHGHRLRASP
ncbi:hypothetical protein OV320_5109 [Actinobacteria bacterium OV320]|nr:hypothetical protein OV320_5109 [Actinobacteria bacterium OV320]